MKRAAAFLLFCAMLTPAAAQNTAIFLQGGSAILESAAAAIKSASPGSGLQAPAGPVMLASSKEKAQADLKDLKTRGVKYIYAVGTGPTVFATQDLELGGVYVFVPNPSGAGLLSRAKWAGVSPYPDPRLVMQHLKGSMAIQRVAVLYTKKQNQEVAKTFQDAADAEKVGCLLVGLTGAEELEQALDPALKNVQAVLLLIDALAFNPDQVRFVVSKCLQAKKPLVGFLENMPEAGVPFAIYAPADELGRTAVGAMKSLQEKGEDRKIWYPQRLVLNVNQAAVQSLGVPYDEKRVVKSY
jgi:ABC-type uncharacterized transport system substrate-binding protein